MHMLLLQGTRKVSLNESQWRDFKGKDDVLGLYGAAHGAELGVKKMTSVHAGCLLLLCGEEDTICHRLWQQRIWRKFGKYNLFAAICEEMFCRPCNVGVDKRGDTLVNFSLMAVFRDFCVSL